jgi:hypothetical protein
MNMLYVAATTNATTTHAVAQNPVLVIIALALVIGLGLALIIYVICEVFKFIDDVLKSLG